MSTNIRIRLFIGGTAAVLGLAVAGCGGGSSSSSSSTSDSDNGNGTVSAGCEASISLADNDQGLGTDAGFDGLHYFALGEDLCALDVASGDSFKVGSGLVTLDSGLVNEKDGVTVPVFGGDVNASGDVEDLTVDRVIYASDNTIHWAGTSLNGSAHPETGQISSEDQAEDITAILVAQDYSDQAGAIAYEKNEQWYAAGIDDGHGVDPENFGEGMRPFAPITDPSDGSAQGWLVHHLDTEEGTDDILKFDLEANEVVLLAGNVESFLGAGLFYLAQFDDGSALIATISGDVEFFLYDGDETMNSLGHKSDILAQVSDGNSLFFTSQSEDDEISTLYKVNETGFTELDDAGTQETRSVLLQLVGDRILWAWEEVESGAGGEVRAVKKDGTEAEVIANADDSTTFDSPVADTHWFQLHRHTDWGFYNEKEAGLLPSQWSAHAVELGGDGEVEHEDSVWQGASYQRHAGTGYFPSVAFSPRSMSEVFLVEKEGGTSEEQPQKLHVADAADPETLVDLGELGESDVMPDVTMSRAGFAPHRLIADGDDLVYVNTRHTDSAETLLVDEEGILRTILGF